MNNQETKSLDKTVWNKTPEFYQELIKSWVKTKVTNTPRNYLDIRKQIIWGNSYIKFKGNCLYFHSLIESDITYINDIIDNNGKISEEVIRSKLINKQNCIAEFAKLKKSIPSGWVNEMKTENSYKTTVNVDKMFCLGQKTIYFQLVVMKFMKHY